jgi:hypothetical protein
LRDRLGKVPAGAPGAGLALLLTLSMAQFMVVLDKTNPPVKYVSYITLTSDNAP